MKVLITISFFILFLTSCGTSTSSINEIEKRLIENSCRINREELIFQIHSIEYVQDTTFSEIPESLLPDSLLFCPSTGLNFILLVDGGNRKIECPSNHGDSSF